MKMECELIEFNILEFFRLDLALFAEVGLFFELIIYLFLNNCNLKIIN